MPTNQSGCAEKPSFAIPKRRAGLMIRPFEKVGLCQILPGAIAMQIAAYAGLRLRGVFGAIVSYIGFCCRVFLL